MNETTTVGPNVAAPCPVAGCAERCCDWYPLCRRHWHSVSVRGRELLFRAVQNYRRQPSPVNTRQVELQRVKAVAEAVRAAIDAAGGTP